MFRLYPLAAAAALLVSSLAAQPVPLSVNPASREEVRQFYRVVYFASENVPMGWTGSYSTGSAGDVSAAFREATRLRLNFYRALAGVPAGITFNSTYNAKDQQAALMMSVNNTLQHVGIPSSWTYYSATGAEAAANSNLALNQAGPTAINGYLSDGGTGNYEVGHRRWIFYPQTQQMGSGDVAGDGSATILPANALWVIDDKYGTARPATRTTQVTYPSAGFIPYQLVWPRWSFTYPSADFSGASVTMTRNGQSVAVKLEKLEPDFGENTLVWVYDNLDSSLSPAPTHLRPSADTIYTVSITNVRIAGASQNFTYNVTVFDPDATGSDSVLTSISGPGVASVGSPSTYTVTVPPLSSSFDWRTLQTSPFSSTFNAEPGSEAVITAVASDYTSTQSAVVGAGTASYHLAHTTRQDQTITLPQTFVTSSATARISFLSRLGFATAAQVAHVQYSTDDGANWADLYTQAGSGAAGETSFISRETSLASLAGRTFRLRFNYTVSPTASAFPQSSTGVGWYLDNISLSGVLAVTAGAPTRVATGSTFSYTPVDTSAVLLQARGVLFTAYPTEWGPIQQVTVASGSTATTARLSNLSVRTTMGAGQTLIVGVNVTEGSRRVLVRAAGPALAGFGLAGAMADPRLDLFNGSTLVLSNDNWDSSLNSAFDSVGAFGFQAGSKDAALTQALNGAYTIQARGTGAGVVLVEAYDLGAGNSPRLSNVSARNLVGTGDNILIAGFNVTGTGTKRLLIRGIGPKLGTFGVTGFLADPKLEVYDSANSKVTENDNWASTLAPTFSSVGAFDLDAGSKDAALVVTLAPGTYTVQLKGADGGTGEGLIEIYEVP